MDIKIVNLTQAIPNETDLVLLSQGGNLRGVTVQEIRDSELREEVEAARGTYDSLGTRLDKMNFILSDLGKKINPIDCGTF